MSADLANISTLTSPERSPATEGRHLHPAALPQWRVLLEFGWQERLERITKLSIAFHEAAEIADAGSGDSQTRLQARHRADMLLRRTVAERRVLADIEAAMTRLAAGRFGWCEQCGRPISTTKLARLPQTTYCTSCDF
jgi:RNA polymerase-binding transcription factor DksA